jgi:hypothetical protein
VYGFNALHYENGLQRVEHLANAVAEKRFRYSWNSSPL